MRKAAGIACLLAVAALLACSGPHTSPSVRLPMPIESVGVALMESLPVQAVVHVRGYLPDSCYAFGGTTLRRDGNAFTIDVHMERTAPPDAMCLMRIEVVERTVPLGPLPPGEYTVSVNGVQRAFRVD